MSDIGKGGQVVFDGDQEIDCSGVVSPVFKAWGRCIEECPECIVDNLVSLGADPEAAKVAVAEAAERFPGIKDGGTPS